MTLELNAILTVLLFDVTKRVIVVTLRCGTEVLFICSEEKLLAVNLDPTEEKLGAADVFIFTRVLLSVTLVVLRDVTDIKPWDKKHVVLQQAKCHSRFVTS